MWSKNTRGKIFFSFEGKENVIHTAVQRQEYCHAQWKRDLIVIQNMSLTFCPHKVTQLWSHLAEKKNKQPTLEIYMGYYTRIIGFRELLSSSHLEKQLCASDHLLKKTKTQLFHLSSAARTPLKNPGFSASWKGWGMSLLIYSDVGKRRLTRKSNCRKQQ